MCLDTLMLDKTLNFIFRAEDYKIKFREYINKNMNMKRIIFVVSLLAYTFLSVTASEESESVTPLYPNSVDLFPLKDVRITEGQFKHIQDLNHQYLLSLEPDRLLSWFRREAGLTPKAKPYPLWESEDFQWTGPLAGHIMGFYLSSMSMLYQTTGDPQIINRLKYTLAGLKEVQDTNGDGYLLATRRGRLVFSEVVSGNFKTSNPVINDVWEPVYIMNKIMLGLYNTFTMCELNEAKPILVKMADWFGHGIIDKLSHDDIQKLLVCEHGSINESYINVYQITGEEKYLRWAERLNDEDMWIPLSKGEDILHGWHANTQIPKFTGFTNVYRFNDDKRLYNAARMFWDIVTNRHTWSNGGNSTGEHFFPEGEFANRVQNFGGPESCNSVNMMRLTEILLQTEADVKYVDYYEKVLFNHVLANFEPVEGMCCYYTSMRPGHYKTHAYPYDSFWCCVGTGLEAPTKFAKLIYMHTDNSLYVNMFIPSVLEWKEKGISVVQQTKYPDSNSVKLLFETKENKDANFKLKIRKPFWAEDKTFKVRVNGRTSKWKISEDGYIDIVRVWRNGDKVDIEFEPKLDVQYLKNSTRYCSVNYGAISMGMKIDNTNIDSTDFRSPTKTVADIFIPISDVPVMYGTPEEIKSRMKILKGDQLKIEYAPEEAESSYLVPFNRIHYSRYALYFVRVDDEMEYHRSVKASSDYNGVKPEMQISVVDSVIIGDAKSETMHKAEFVSCNSGSLDMKKYWRRATEGGFMMYNLKSLPDKHMTLWITTRAADQDIYSYSVRVDGREMKTFERHGDRKNLATDYFYERIDLPNDLTQGKKDITVKIEAIGRGRTADVLDVRLQER